MNIVICGAGEVGRHAAEVLSANGSNNITMIDADEKRLDQLEDMLDIRLLYGNGAHGDTLIEAGCVGADLFIAAVSDDVTNLLSASIAKGVGAKTTVARVHHSAFFERRGLEYDKYLGIDHMVCPEYTTALAIAQTLRSPGALAVEQFARGRIEMQSLAVSDNAPAITKMLKELAMPGSTKVAAIERDGTAFIPDRETKVLAGDVISLVGEAKNHEKSRAMFHTEKPRRMRVMIMGGTSLGVWISRALNTPNFSVRLFESNRERAEELSEKLDWVTVLTADATEADVLREEHIDQVDAFVTASDDDENNILTALLAKTLGVKSAIVVLQRGTYLNLLEHVGIDRAFSPRVTAVAEILRRVDDSPVRKLATLAEGVADVYEFKVPAKAKDVIGKPLSQLKLPPRTIIVAIQRAKEVHFPTAGDSISAEDKIVAVAPTGSEKALQKVFMVE